MPIKWIVLSVLGLLSPMLGCAPSVKIDRVSPAATRQADMQSVLTDNGISTFTRQVARLHAWPEPEHFFDDLAQARTRLEDPAWHSSPDTLTAFAEILLAEALAARSPRLLAHRRVVALRAADFAARALGLELANGTLPLGDRSHLASSLLNRATVIAFQALADSSVANHLAGRASSPLGDFVISLQTDSGAPWDAAYFDRFVDADTLRVVGLRNRHRVRALGAPLVAIRNNTPERQAEEPFFPPEGIVYPVTLTLRVQPPAEPGGPRRATFTMHDPTRTQRVDFAGHRVPISSDLTAAFGVLHASTNLAAEGQNAMLFVEDLVPKTGMYLLEPYDPDRIPLVLVHGLRSSPLTWRDVVNDLRADPAIASKYQVWMFVYPTGLPIPRSAFYLRDALREVRAHYDPQRASPAIWNALVVGHSMGGVLVRTLIHEMDEQLWDALYTQPRADLDISPETRQHLDEVFDYDPDPGVGRVVFIAAPHRGSPSADDWRGRLGAIIQVLPDSLEAIGREIRDKNPDALSEHLRSRNEYFVPTSIDTLSEKSPVLRAYDNAPFVAGLPFHTITGNRGRPESNPVSDGTVPYTSSHLEGAESELVVPAGHDAHGHPLAIAELRRILRLHAARKPFRDPVRKATETAAP